jgi:hypothetical protein
MLFVASVYSQISTGSNTYGGGAEYVGWNATGTPTTLDIKNNSSTPSNIDFYINATKFLQVLTTGNLNIVASTNAYQINGNPVLWHNGNTTDIFLGVAAGNNSMSGHYNAIIGNTAGLALTSGHNNVALGYEALLSGTTTYVAVAVGFHAAKYTTTGCGVIAIGEESTRQNTTGSYNIGIGLYAMNRKQETNFHELPVKKILPKIFTNNPKFFLPGW